MLLFYSLCCRRLCVSSFREFPVFPISCPIPDFYAKIPAPYARILCYNGFYARYRIWFAVGGGGLWEGVPLGGLEASSASYLFLAGRVV